MCLQEGGVQLSDADCFPPLTAIVVMLLPAVRQDYSKTVSDHQSATAPSRYGIGQFSPTAMFLFFRNSAIPSGVTMAS